MTRPLAFKRNSKGQLEIQGDDERLIAFLETEMQEAPEIIGELVALLKNGDDSEFHGNAHSVVIREKTVTIECNFEDDAPDRRLDRNELLSNLESLLQFIG